MITKEILTEKEMHQKLKSGVDKLANVVKTTLGPKGRNVLIKTGFDEIIATKDGVTVAREIRLPDPVESMGASLVKSVSVRVNDLAGDGTTSSIIFAQSMYADGLEYEGNVYERQKRMNNTLNAVISLLEESAKKDINADDIYNIAFISSNGDVEISTTLKKLYEELGKNLTILVDKGNAKTEVEYSKGMKIENGFMSPYSIQDFNKLKTVFNNPLVYIFNGKIKRNEQITHQLLLARKAERPLLIIADGISNEPLSILAENHQQGVVQSAVVKSPGYSQRKIELLSDIAILTGGKVIQENSTMKYFKTEDFGELDTVSITMNDTILVKNKPDKKKIEKRVKEIQEKISTGLENDYEQRKLKERLSNLTSGIAVIKVGAKTETELLERKDRFEDAKSAIMSALEEGIVEGGGVALLHALSTLMDSKNSCKIVLKSLSKITEQLLINAGHSEFNTTAVINSIINGEAKSFNIEDGTVSKETMFDKNIVDPLKTLKESLKAAVSVVGTLLTTDSLVLNVDDGSGKISFN